MPNEPRALSPTAATIICLVLALPLGGMLGVLNLGLHIRQPEADAAFEVGVAVGFLTCWAPALALRLKRLRYALPAVYGPSAACSFLLNTPTFPAGMLLTIGFFILWCFAVMAILPNARFDAPNLYTCSFCGHDLASLPSRVCPTCGVDNAQVPMRCIRCKYDLRGLHTRTCPECGLDHAATDAVHLARRR